ncbi:hypothetical protein ACHWQZ_G002982 [Mnemiopsis leidyi]
MLWWSLFAVLIAVSTADLDTDDKPEEKKSNGTIIGIDLGTTYSCVGVFKNGRVEIIANDQGNRITPSYVAFTHEGERLIGDAAKNQLTSNTKNTVFDAKRMIGRTWDDTSLQKDIKFFPFKTVPKDDKPHIQVEVNGQIKSFTPEEISSMVLTKMKETAEAYLGAKVTEAVVTVPAYFNDAQRKATKDAGVIAGLDIKRIINEPTAAAIAYGLDTKNKGDEKAEEKSVLVFDLGGGTFDVSLLMIENGVFEVVATNGDTHLGGEDFDQRVIQHYVKLYKKKKNIDLTKSQRAIQKLRREVEKAKRALSIQHQTRIEIESLIDGEDFGETLTRARFEELNMDLFKSTMIPVKKVLEDAGMKPEEVDEIVLVGGSTRIPKVQELVREMFKNKEPVKGINPDEAVAYGAAVQAGILGGESQTKGIILLDVCPLSLGHIIEGGIMDKMIPRNSVIPTKKVKMYTTTVDNQDTIEIEVMEGERPMGEDNHRLGKFEISGIRPAKRGVPQIQVTFEVDNNGVLHVSAKDMERGTTESITINNDQNRLSQEDIKKMIEESEKFARMDKKVKEQAEAKLELERLAYSLKSDMEDKEEGKLGSKITEEDRTVLTAAINKAIKFADEAQYASTSELKEETKKLNTVVRQIHTKNMKKGEKTKDKTEGKTEL